MDHPLEPMGVYDRVIKLSPWLPSSIPRLLEGAAKSTCSEKCAIALVNYGIDSLSILKAAADGLLKVLGSFDTF